MNDDLKEFVSKNYPNTKSDLFAAFMERVPELTKENGYMGFVTPFVWMFIKSHEWLREYMLKNTTITNLVQLEYNAFGPAVVPVCSFTLKKGFFENEEGKYIKLSEFRGVENQPIKTLEAINGCVSYLFNIKQSEFLKIPAKPIIYWFSNKIINGFQNDLFNNVPIYTGMATSDNGKFLRFWQEVVFSQIKFNSKSVQDTFGEIKWFPYNKGGSVRKWYGNLDYLVNFQNDGYEIKEEVNRKYPYLKGNTGFYIRYQEHYFKKGLTWSAITSSSFTTRIHPEYSIFSNAGFVAIPS